MSRICKFAFLCLTALCCSSVNAIILYSGDNSANQSDPGTGAPYYAVGRLCTEGGPLSTTRGSAVYLTGKYLLTADHVLDTPHITFDGSTFWEIDSQFAPVQIGTTDMKIIKMVDDPELQDVTLMSGSSSGNIATMIGWGRGRDTNTPDSSNGPVNTWKWPSNDDSVAKRWGTNNITAVTTTTYPLGGKNYSYTSLASRLNRNAGNNEASVCLYDSGGGAFINDNGTWKLAGIMTFAFTQTANVSSFNDTDQNRFVEISPYKNAIEAALPELTTYSGWKTDNSVNGESDASDTDRDGVPLLHEFAFGGDPKKNDSNILPSSQLVDNEGNRYLEIILTRPISLQDIIYTPQTTSDLSSWPTDSTGIDNPSPAPVNNSDGTETLTYRRTATVESIDQAFIRIEVSEDPI